MPESSILPSDPGATNVAARRKFDVFISYSRRDSAFALALYKALSSYTPPSGLGLPDQRLKVFIDRSDFTGVDYAEAIARHLGEAGKLVVVCSPNARQHPKYINDEIRQFVERNGATNVIPVLLAGIPNNEASPEQEAQLAFPQQLCDALGMPLARDFRGFDERTRRLDKGRFEESWYFLLADIYDRSRSEIERRDQVRRARRQRQLLAAAGILVAVLSALTITAFIQRNTAVTRLIRSYQSNAQRRIDESDVPGAVVWYTEALKLRDNELIRVRLAGLLHSYPRLVRVFLAGKNACDFSPDSIRIVCADSGSAARIWNVATGAALSPALPNGGAVTTVAFSRDGRKVVTADSTGTSRIWDVASGQSIGTLSLPASIRQARFTPASERVVVAAEDGSMRVWDAATGQPVTPLMKHTSPLLDVALSNDGTRIATILDDKSTFRTLSVWDATSGQLVAPPIRRPYNGFSMAFTSANDVLYVETSREGLAVCNAVSSACRPLPNAIRSAESTSFSSNGRQLLVVGGDHVVRAVDLETGELIGEEMKHGPAVTRALFTPDASKILTVDYTDVLHTWDVSRAQESRSRIERVDHTWLSPDGRRLAVIDDAVTASGNVQVVDVNDGYDVTGPMRQSQAVREVRFSPDGRYVLIVGTSSWLWELEPNAFRQLPDSSHPHVWAAGFDRARRSLLVIGDRRSVRVWDVNDAHDVTPVMAHENDLGGAWIVGSRPYVITQSFINRPGAKSIPILNSWDGTTGQRTTPPLQGGRLNYPVQVSPDGKRVIVQMDDGGTRVWNLAPQGSDSAIELPKQVRAATFASSGLCTATAPDTSTLRISDRGNGAPVGPNLDVGNVEHVSLAPDCNHVATIDGDERLRIWDTRTGRFVVPRRQDDDAFGFFQAAVFSPNGDWVATQANDGTARVWSAATGEPRTEPLRGLNDIRSVGFTADGRYVTAVGRDLTAMAWDAETGERVGEFARAPFSIVDEGIFAWSSDGRRAIAAANAYIKDLNTADVVVRVHTLDPDARDVGSLSTLAQLMAGRRVDQSGSFVSLTRAELASLAAKMR